MRVGILALWLVLCVVLLATGAVTSPFRSEPHAIPGTASFGDCLAGPRCQGSFRADDTRDTQVYVVFYSPQAEVSGAVHGRLVDPSSTAFYADGERSGSLWPFVGFVVLLISFVVMSVRMFIRWRRRRGILAVDPPTD